MSLLGNLLQTLSGLAGGTNSTVGVQILNSATIDYSITTPQTVYTAPSGNTKNIIFTQFILRDPDGVTPSDTLGLQIYYNSFPICVLPDYYIGVQNPTGPLFYQGPVYFLSPMSATPSVTAIVLNQKPTSSGTVIVDCIGYAV